MASPSAATIAKRERAAADGSWHSPETRIRRVLELLARIPRMPDAGKHRRYCELHGHTDCLADEIVRILTGGER
jgi:hypothetical protein